MATKCIHKYRLKDLARKKDTPPYLVYVCVKQDCSHNIRVELVDGKVAECNRCGDNFIMKLSKLKHGSTIIVRPHCEDCTKTPDRIRKVKDRVSQDLDSLIDSILPKGM
jgi:hypothetical protein